MGVGWTQGQTGKPAWGLTNCSNFMHWYASEVLSCEWARHKVVGLQEGVGEGREKELEVKEGESKGGWGMREEGVGVGWREGRRGQ